MQIERSNGHNPLLLRPMVPEDERFIYSSWLRSFRPFAGEIIGAVYFDQHNRVIERILRRCAICIAGNVEDQNQILGYFAFEHRAGILVAHYLYVKAPFRHMGIARTLIEAAFGEAGHGFQHTHQTPCAKGIIRQFRSVFNPYLAHEDK